jgi:hypothetical protein
LTVGGIMIAEGWFALTAGNDSTFQNSMLPLLAMVAGASLLLGLTTPIGSVLATLLNAGMALSWLQHLSIAQPKQELALLAVVAAALGLLGPGGCSIDSFLFGRREIVIPRQPKPTDI